MASIFQRLRSRRVTIRYSLLRNVIILIALTAVAILAVTVVGASRAVSNLSQSLIDRTADRTETELRLFFEPVRRNISVTASWGESGMLDPTDTEGLNRTLRPLLREYPQVSSTMVAETTGREHLLLRLEGEWKNRISRADEWEGRTHWKTWDEAGNLVAEEWKELDYDCRKRPWFRGAIDAGDGAGVVWTEPYTFFTTKDPGITATHSWQHPNLPGVTQVQAMDVLLTDISRFTTQLDVSANGMAFVLTDDGKVLGLPRDERFSTVDGIKSAVLQPVADIDVDPVADAVARWEDRDRPKEGAFELSSGGDTWWAGFRPFDLGNRRLWIAVLVPEADFMGEVRRQRNIIIGIAIAALVFAVLLAFFFARSFSQPLEKLAESSHRIRDFDLRPGVTVESRLAEVDELAQAQEQMLSALQSFAKYVPMEVVHELFKRNEVARIDGRTETLTVLFTDIRGFTTLAEGMQPSELTDHMSEYFEEMLEILLAERATVDKFIGDAIMAFWGAPNPEPQHALRAVRACLRCAQRLDELGAEWEQRGLPPLPTCFGLHVGELVVGNMGAPTRLAYTVLGDTVNLASRIEGINRVYGTDILLTQTVVDEIGDAIDVRKIDVVAVKGKAEAVAIYEPIGVAGETSAERLETAAVYERALALYQNAEFTAAIAELDDIEGDPPAGVLRVKCETYIASPPPAGWDGVTRMTSK
jgi:adenylate cyclase